jgi:Tfp pilus assembly protein PilV
MKTNCDIPTTTRDGITLLEVLIAAGILVVGLTSVLAMLPAAGSLFGEASMSDRAASLASNAAADLRFQGLFKASDFSNTVKTSVFASNQGPTPVINAAAFAGTTFKRTPLPEPDTLLTEQAYGRAGYAAIVSPLADSASYTAGAPARVTIVVFKSRTPETESITLTQNSPGVYEISGGSVQQREDRRKRLLAPCSWIAVRAGNNLRWLHIGSSWATGSKSFVSFTDAQGADDTIPGGTVSGFTGVLKVEDHIIELD